MDDILIEIKCHVPGHETKEFSVTTSENNTVVGLIRKSCKENAIPMRTSYVLRDSRHKVLAWSSTLRHCGVTHGAILYLSSEDEDVHVTNGCTWNTWWFVAAICLLIAGVGATAIAVLMSKNGEIAYKYGVVMDAGSSHTSLFVYKWDGEKLRDTALARQTYTCRVKGAGITSYAEMPSNLSAPLEACLEQAKNRVPTDKHKTTPVFLGATAGMRMLNIVNKTQSDAILKEVRKSIKKSPFKFDHQEQQARIISGQEEGTFGWVTANYLSGTYGVVPPKADHLDATDSEGRTVGALDMGGASTQITFHTPQLKTEAKNYTEDLLLYGANYSVYTHSYLCYGINEAIRKYMAYVVNTQGVNNTNFSSPCGFHGNIMTETYSNVFEAPCAKRFSYNFDWNQMNEMVDKDANYTFIGTANETECDKAVMSIFNFTAPCPLNNCTFNGVYQPPVYGEFYAFSSFFYEMDFLNLTRNSSFSLDSFETDLSRLCNEDWEVVKTKKTGDPAMLGWYCFEGHYIHTLLTKGYKFDKDSWSNIHFIKKINNTDIGWSLGYMINSSNVIKVEGPETFISTPVFSALIALFAIFMMLSIGFGCYAKKYQKYNAGKFYESVPTYGAV